MASAHDSPLGEYIRRQGELQELSLRQLADLVGISTPYLPQIEGAEGAATGGEGTSRPRAPR
jgi:transcriptional regulator with XRE-family HTH domain